MKRFLIGLGIVGLITIALVARFGDLRYHTIMLAPVAANGWVEPPPFACGKSCTRYPDCDHAFLHPLACWIYPRDYPAPWHVRYEDEGVRIFVNATDLSPKDPVRYGEWDGMTPAALRGKVLIDVIVQEKNPGTIVDLARVELTSPCGPGIGKRPDGAPSVEYFEYTRQGYPISLEVRKHPGFHDGALLFQADASKLQQCTLSFKNAVKNTSGHPIPDVHFQAVPVAYWYPY